MRIRDWSSDVCSSDLFDADKPPGVFLQHDAGKAVCRKGHGVDADAVAPHDDAAAGGVTVHDQVPMAPPRPQEFPADPQQVLRVLIFQGPPRFDPGVNEVVVARFVRSEEHTSELQSLMRISYAD